jgi:hypothetical protein
MTKATCYMCELPEMSREHARPLCFFPEAQEFGRDVRNNLITVPSCDAHNSAKSKDDEFLRGVMPRVVSTARRLPSYRALDSEHLLRSLRRTFSSPIGFKFVHNTNGIVMYPG